MKARAKIVPSTTTTCGEVTASTDYLTQSIGISPYVAPGYQTASGGTYATWNVNQGTSTISYVPVGGYVLKLACFTGINPVSAGTGLSAFVSSGQTVTMELGFSYGTAWAQSRGGDVYAASALYSPIPVGASPGYFSLDGAGSTPGVITYGLNYDFDSDSASVGTSNTSSTGWIANESYSLTDYYAVMYHRFGSPTVEDYPGGSTVSTRPASRATPYYVNGDLTIDVPGWTVASGESVVFIVNGDIIVSPDVGRAYTSSVPSLEGMYITSPTGTFRAGVSTTIIRAQKHVTGK